MNEADAAIEFIRQHREATARKRCLTCQLPERPVVDELLRRGTPDTDVFSWLLNAKGYARGEVHANGARCPRSEHAIAEHRRGGHHQQS